MVRNFLGTIGAIAYVAGVFKAFGSGLFIGFVSIFVPPVAIFMLFT